MFDLICLPKIYSYWLSTAQFVYRKYKGFSPGEIIYTLSKYEKPNPAEVGWLVPLSISSFEGDQSSYSPV